MPRARILVTRTDRLGDVLLSIPSLELLRQAFPEAVIDFLVRPALIDVLTPYLASRRIAPVPYEGAWPGGRYDAALVLFDEPGLSRGLWRSRIALRVGAYSKPRSFLFLNRGRRQRRGLAERNEAEYNLELARLLVEALGGAAVARPGAVRFPLNAPAAGRARAALAALGIEGSYVVAHPGMGGSALNLSAAAYRRLFAQLETRGLGRIVLSEGPAERDRALVAGLGNLPVIRGLDLAALGEVFRGASLVVAPSTGPLHLAHYVGAPTLGIYSPVRTQRARRWEPWGGSGRSLIWAPDVECPGTRDCRGAECRHYSCLEVMAGGGLPSVLADALNEATS